MAVIGNGSSGIQIVPAMLPDVAHIDHYVRGRTWLSPTFAREKIDERGGAGLDNSRRAAIESPLAVPADIVQSRSRRKRLKNSKLIDRHIRNSGKARRDSSCG